MAKQYRGKSLGKTASKGRGICPVCYATRTKLLYKRKKDDGSTVSVCKRCVNAAAERLNQTQAITLPIAYRRKHRRQFNQLVAQQKSS